MTDLRCEQNTRIDESTLKGTLKGAAFRLAGLAVRRYPDGWDNNIGLADYIRCATPGCPNGVPQRNGNTGALPRYCLTCKDDRLKAQKKASRDRKAGKLRPAQPWTPPPGSPAAPGHDGPYPEHGGGGTHPGRMCDRRAGERADWLFGIFGDNCTEIDLADQNARERLEGHNKDAAAVWLAANDHGE